MLNRTILLMMSAIAASVPGVSYAVPVTFEFTGNVGDFIQDQGGRLDGSILPHGEFWGTYTFESSTPDGNPDDRDGQYTFQDPAANTLSLHIGDYHVAAPLDSIGVQTATYSVMTQDFSFLGTQARIVIDVVDIWQPLFENDALPLEPPGVSLAGRKAPFTFYSVGSSELGISGHVNSIIPEPQSLAFFLIWVLAAGNRRMCVGWPAGRG